MPMPKKKNVKTSVRLDPDVEETLRQIADSDPLKPSLSQLVNKLVRIYGHRLKAVVDPINS